MLLAQNQPTNWRIFFATRRYLIATIAAVGVVCLLVIFVMIPQFNEMLALRSKLQAEQPKLDRLQQKLAELDDIQFTPEFIQAHVVNEALPSYKPLLELLTSLNTAAVSTGVTIRDFKISPGLIATESAQLSVRSGRTGAIDSLEVNMRVAGEFGRMQDFLLLVEKVTPFTTITQLTMGIQGIGLVADPEEYEQKVINATLTTKTYFFTQSISAAVEAPLPRLTAKDQEVLRDLAAFDLTELPEQKEIIGGGLEDLFDLEFNALQQLLQEPGERI
jgi:Tfp pilus assembly protein PilO